ncbi:MAG: tRNA 2-thiouridine(34) synthase MnmA [Clostridiales bacterium]|nr:tRNA 2-thiouridine(34) synthase MnmA [Clostridiales bacterium]
MADNSVLVGMSGGVDSSVAAALLLEQGYGVTGCTMHLFGNDALGVGQESTCCSLSDVEDARRVCWKLGIAHYVLNFKEQFRREVMQDFAESYLRGETPNPCIRCNGELKFGAMLHRGAELGLDYVATGHYARIEKSGDRYLLKKAADGQKDQTYFLYNLTQAQLAHTLMPLGGLTKEEVRQIAEQHGFLNAKKGDSQDICFVPDGDYGAFIERFTGQTCPPGDFIDRDGNVLGRHRGHIRYTLGQRKGLEIALGQRTYVTAKDPERNTVTLGGNEELFSDGLEARGLNLIACDRLDGPTRCTVKIRHSRQEAPATAVQTGERTLEVRFDQPQRAVTPGQAVVLYSDEVVLGGATIDRAIQR